MASEDNIVDSVQYRHEAELRSNCIDSQDMEYHLYFCLQKGTSYSGLVEIRFYMKKLDDIFLDYSGKKVLSQRLNGNDLKIDENTLKDGKIWLPKDKLFEGDSQNQLTIEYANNYYNDGNGLHSYIDVDGAQYMYIQSEPFYGNRACPMFDQPDLKAEFTIYTTTPADWKVISCEECEQEVPWNTFNSGIDIIPKFEMQIRHKFSSEIQPDFLYRKFKKTRKLATYLVNFSSGPFNEITLPEEHRFQNIPMKLYCRQTMSEYVQNESHNIFSAYKMGIEFYQEMFDYKYPFSKCDSIVCPEFVCGAMEFPGSITLAEHLIGYSKLGISELSKLTTTLLHELAHMWFGNTATMKWWNDLWLNEAFADFQCYYCFTEIVNKNWHKKHNIEYVDPRVLKLRRIQNGYFEDTKPTTHAVAAEIDDTTAALDIFDGITYCKGMSVQTNLFWLTGIDVLKATLKEYIKTFEWKNATLDDLLNILQKKVNEMVPGAQDLPYLNITQWKEDWLLAPGLNSIEVLPWGQKGLDDNGQELSGEFNKICFLQSAFLNKFPTQRYHSFEVVFFDQNCKIVHKKKVHLDKTEMSSFDIATEMADLVKDGVKISAVQPNYGNMDFVDILLDSQSKKFFLENLTKIEDEHDSCMIILNLTSDATHTGQFDSPTCKYQNPTELLEVLVDALKSVQKVTVFDTILTCISNLVRGNIQWDSSLEFFDKIFDVLYERFEIEENSTILAKLITEMVKYGHTESHIETLKKLYDDSSNNESAKVKLSLPIRWNIVFGMQKCKSYSDDEKKKYWDEVYNSDQTDKKRELERRLKAHKAQSGPEREELQNRFFSTEGANLTFGECKSYAEELNSVSIKRDIRRQHYDRFFETFPKIAEKRGEEIAKYTFELLCPNIDTHLPMVIARVEELSNTLASHVPKISTVVTGCVAIHLERQKNYLNVRNRNSIFN